MPEKNSFSGEKNVYCIFFNQKNQLSRFNENTIEIGVDKVDDQQAIRRLLYTGYKTEASVIYPEMLNKALKIHENQMFKPIRTDHPNNEEQVGQLLKEGNDNT